MINLKEPKIFVFEKKHYKLKNGDSTKGLPKGLVKSLKESGYIKEKKDGNEIRK